MAIQPPTARLDGQRIFGDPDSFAWAPLASGPASIDAFLGNTPGTTIYGRQSLFGLSGTFVAPTRAGVQAMLDILASYAGVSAPLGVPTSEKFVGVNFKFLPRYCYFLPAEYRPSAIAAGPGTQSSATYRVVFRMVGP